MSYDGGGRLERVAPRVVLGEEGEPEVDVGQPFALDQAAHPDRGRRLPPHHEVQSESVFTVRWNQFAGDMTPGILDRLDLQVTDETDPARIVHQGLQERRVVFGELAQHQTVGLENRHGLSGEAISVPPIAQDESADRRIATPGPERDGGGGGVSPPGLRRLSRSGFQGYHLPDLR